MRSLESKLSAWRFIQVITVSTLDKAAGAIRPICAIITGLSKSAPITLRSALLSDFISSEVSRSLMVLPSGSIIASETRVRKS